jgi:hypothetical protein
MQKAIRHAIHPSFSQTPVPMLRASQRNPTVHDILRQPRPCHTGQFLSIGSYLLGQPCTQIMTSLLQSVRSNNLQPPVMSKAIKIIMIRPMTIFLCRPDLTVMQMPLLPRVTKLSHSITFSNTPQPHTADDSQMVNEQSQQHQTQTCPHSPCRVPLLIACTLRNSKC